MIRAVAICVFRQGDRILVARGTDPVTDESFHRPLGGGVEFGEHSVDALRREMDEELGTTIESPRLLGILENVFEYAGRPRHEIVFVYDARLSNPSWYERAELPVTESGHGWRAARWIPIAELSSGQELLVPEGLLALLQTERPGETGHSAHRSTQA